VAGIISAMGCGTSSEQLSRLTHRKKKISTVEKVPLTVGTEENNKTALLKKQHKGSSPSGRVNANVTVNVQDDGKNKRVEELTSNNDAVDISRKEDKEDKDLKEELVVKVKQAVIDTANHTSQATWNKSIEQPSETSQHAVSESHLYLVCHRHPTRYVAISHLSNCANPTPNPNPNPPLKLLTPPYSPPPLTPRYHTLGDIYIIPSDLIH